MTVAEVIAQSLIDLDVRVVTHVPGHGGTQTFDAYRKLTGIDHPVSFHEEVAYTVAHGAALVGARSCCLIKTHGFVKAMNSVIDSLSCGTTASFVTILFDDKTGKHSDNIFEIEPILYGSRIPYKVTTASTLLDDLTDAFQDSQFDSLPYCLVLDADEISKECESHPIHVTTPTEGYKRNIAQHLVTPIFAEHQHKLLEWKLNDEPHPGDPEIKSLQDSLPPTYLKAVEPYLPVFEAFADIPFEFVSGDAGVSTLSAFPPYNIVSAATYMGGSLPLAMGAYLAGRKHSWAFTGDFSFIAAGHLGLIEAIERNIPLKLVIYANGTAQTTGGQPLDLAHLDRLLKGYESYVTRMNVSDQSSMRAVLTEANASEELRIIVATFK
jgi:TPP-dependent indolepyruvate ferredoxin oxidoreductase alpha subunit